MGTNWSIPIDYEVEPFEKPEEQTRQRGCRSVRGRREQGQPQQQFQDVPIGGVHTDPLQSRVGYYLDNIRGMIHYQNRAIDMIYTHFQIERKPDMPPHGPYIPT